MEQLRSEKGVSLVEMLVALLILSFVSVSTLAMFSQGMRLNRAGADYSTITNIAKGKCEELLGLPYADPHLTPDTQHRESNARFALIEISWRVAEHSVVKGSVDIASTFAGGSMRSTAAGSGNIKAIAVTISSKGRFAAGRRTVTVQGIKVRE